MKREENLGFDTIEMAIPELKQANSTSVQTQPQRRIMSFKHKVQQSSQGALQTVGTKGNDRKDDTSKQGVMKIDGEYEARFHQHGTAPKLSESNQPTFF